MTDAEREDKKAGASVEPLAWLSPLPTTSQSELTRRVDSQARGSGGDSSDGSSEEGGGTPKHNNQPLSQQSDSGKEKGGRVGVRAPEPSRVGAPTDAPVTQFNLHIEGSVGSG